MCRYMYEDPDIMFEDDIWYPWSENLDAEPEFKYKKATLIVAGAYYSQYELNSDEVTEGANIDLVRECSDHDTLSIRVEYNGALLGYIGRDDNRKYGLAKDMDSIGSKVMNAEIVSKYLKANGDIEIEIEVEWRCII